MTQPLPTRPYVIFSLPRSRSAWLAHFLSYGPLKCGHDLAVECRHLGDFLLPFVEGRVKGTVETGAAIAWPLIKYALSSAQLVVVRRPVEEVVESLARIGVDAPSSLVEELRNRARLLDELSSQAGVMTVQFKSLGSEACCKWLFEHTLETEFDRAWWEYLAPLNIQINMLERLKQLARNQDALRVLKNEIKLGLRALQEGDQESLDSLLAINSTSRGEVAAHA